ncbi:prenyltransferase [Flavilitoribacter nigricans]|uniref:Prenyltransferase n=1 Tax=Flavilitoribacter nigricans (strain ATCC 23147 / DSM 23189 / NBRC 102662 / NCIMB 1420 / SS-2) TaxID=1122177 RepID=A0A2D0NDV0_FLAN2|nr:prenyltransferase [Flavilitoribacter nigricans]PHN06647.1 prenyltransferase [Flavilitoribacter nigricans DSM 23189 = NBRC 102662]
MISQNKYQADIDYILAQRNHLGDDFWTTEDNRIGKGSPFSARDVAIFLNELGFTRKDVIVQGLAERIFQAWRPDGRFRIAPKGTIYPCHTITMLRVLCYLGYHRDDRLAVTFQHLFDIQHDDGGWRCNTVKMGKDPLTDCSNPGVTLEALDAFRHTDDSIHQDRLDPAVDFLLGHWEIKRPIGPCHFGIGSLFMQVEFPFLRYNLFYYVYTLACYERARADRRFQEAYTSLREKVIDGKMVIENTNHRLSKLDFCKKGAPSACASARWNEIADRMADL